MLLSILSVSFPFAAVGPDAVGGAEQILSRLDHALTAAGHSSLVVACEGSQTAGKLFSFPMPKDDCLSPADRLACTAAVQAAINRGLATHPVDVIHLHGLDLDSYILPNNIPVVITLHLPVSWYQSPVWSRYAGHAQFCCVSRSQRRSLPAGVRHCAVIENGVPLPTEDLRWPRGDFALTLGRICPEKNAHEALEAGTRTGTRVLLGGEVFPYPQHQQYFESQIAPRLRHRHGDRPQHAFLGRLQEHHKQALLGRAKCLLHPTLAPETSSLVAMEALAAGTPVIAYPSGALPDILEEGITGFLVHSVDEMAQALRHIRLLSPRACREAARRRFSLDRMTSQYLDLYQSVAHPQPLEALCA